MLPHLSYLCISHIHSIGGNDLTLRISGRGRRNGYSLLLMRKYSHSPVWSDAESPWLGELVLVSVQEWSVTLLRGDTLPPEAIQFWQKMLSKSQTPCMWQTRCTQESARDVWFGCVHVIANSPMSWDDYLLPSKRARYNPKVTGAGI